MSAVLETAILETLYSNVFICLKFHRLKCREINYKRHEKIIVLCFSNSTRIRKPILYTNYSVFSRFVLTLSMMICRVLLSCHIVTIWFFVYLIVVGNGTLIIVCKYK